MFNISAFTAEVKDRREEALDLVGTSPLIKTYRDALRIVCDDAVWTTKEPVAAVYTAKTLRAELSAAALACGLQGATQKQIDLLVSLCAAKGDFRDFGISRLTKGQASGFIDDLQK